MRNIMNFAGRSSVEFGIIVTTLPAIPTPEERGEAIEIPGRNGDIWDGEGAYMPITITVPIWVPPTASLTQVRGWLTGEGKLKFDNGSLYWDARVAGSPSFTPSNLNDGWTANIAFLCQPFRGVEGNDILVSSSPYTLQNPYSAYSEPLLAVECTGDFEINVNGTLASVTGLTGTVMLDTLLQACYQGTNLTNGAMTGAFHTLVPGENTISYTGDVTRITITPRWRTL